MSTIAKKPRAVAPAPEGPVLYREGYCPIKSLGEKEPHPALKQLLIEVALDFRWVSRVTIEFGRGWESDSTTQWWVVVDRVSNSAHSNEDIYNMLEGVKRGWDARQRVGEKGA